MILLDVSGSYSRSEMLYSDSNSVEAPVTRHYQYALTVQGPLFLVTEFIPPWDYLEELSSLEEL